MGGEEQQIPYDSSQQSGRYHGLDGRFKLTRKQRKNLKEHELKPFLIDHEIVRLQKEENKFVKVRSKVKTIKPLSDKMVEWLPKQQEIYKKRNGITIED